MLGIVAAGQPIEAVLSHDTVPVPKDMQGRGRTFALRVRGDSMIEENIQDGDIIIVASQKTADNGQVVVALIDGNYATVKKFYREPDFIRLEPANPQFKPIFVKTPERIQIQGVVRGLIRKYDHTAMRVSVMIPSGQSEVEFLGFALSDCTVRLDQTEAKYLRVVHRTALELAVPNHFGVDVGGYWLMADQIEQLRKPAFILLNRRGHTRSEGNRSLSRGTTGEYLVRCFARLTLCLGWNSRLFPYLLVTGINLCPTTGKLI